MRNGRPMAAMPMRNGRRMEKTTMNEGLKTSLYLDERPVFIHIIQDAPDQGIIARIKNELLPIPEAFAEPGEQNAGKIGVLYT